MVDTRILDKNSHKTVNSILTSGKFINGPYGQEFSKLWAQECGARYCVPTASGMASLITTLKSVAALSNRRHVIVPNLSFAATAFAVVEAGLNPVYCGVNKNGLLNQDNCLDIIKSLPILAVIPVYLYGQWFEINPKILAQTVVIEDACQAHGVVKKVQGKAACFSFYPSKNLGAAGDAGAIVMDDEEIRSYCEKYINYGDAPGQKYSHEIQGNNLRMDEIQAAVLIEKLKGLKEFNTSRARIAVEYMKAGIDSFVNLENNSFHLYPILVKDRDSVMQTLKKKGIETGNHYPYILSDICRGDAQFLKDDYSGEISSKILTLPFSGVAEVVSNLPADLLYASV